MAKLTYSEQLKHPNWQRRRLEALQASYFTCEECGDAESTLNVHHKRYVRGRMAWEYENKELMVVCDSCHTDAHNLKSSIELVLCALSSYEIKRVLGYARGQCSLLRGPDPFLGLNVDTYECAEGIADAFDYLTPDIVETLAKKEGFVSSERLWEEERKLKDGGL